VEDDREKRMQGRIKGGKCNGKRRSGRDDDGKKMK
jgi:hypothetical protein